MALASFALLIGGSALAQGPEVLRNADVVTMTKSGLAADVIVLKIESSMAQFDTSAGALAVLKAAGVSDQVIATMVKAGIRATETRPQVSQEPAKRAGALAPAPVTIESSKPIIVVLPFTVPADITWPYDAKQLHSQVVLILKTKGSIKDRFEIVGEKVESSGSIYTLTGEVVAWKAGNRATRLLVGMGTGRESAEISYQLKDQRGTRVFEHEDTIRAAFVGNAVAGSVGQLAEPFAAKLADRLENARLPGR
jgi:hypothetical protein